MKSISKLHSIVFYDDKHVPYFSFPLDSSMTVKTINDILDVVSHTIPRCFSVRLE